MNKRKLTLAAVLCSLFFALLISCDKKVGMLPVTAAPTTSSCDTVTYTRHIKKIIDDYCISCHGDVNPVGGFSLNSYSQLKTYADNGQIKSTVFDSPPVPELMPQGGPPLPQAQKALLSCWLTNGKKQ